MCTSCASCIRFLMIIFNIVFTVIGLVLLGAGLYFHFSSFGFRGMENYNFLAYTFILIITVGALSVVLGILGCCGSYHYSRCLLGFYFALLLIIFAAEIAVGVAGFVYRDQAQQLVHLTLKAGVEDIKLHRGEIRWMDTIQIMFQCCGYDNQLDYGILHYVPNTCCPNQQCSIGNSIFPYFPGCKGKIDSIMHNYFVMCILFVSIAFVELIGLIFSMTLCCAVRGREHEGYYRAVRA